MKPRSPEHAAIIAADVLREKVACSQRFTTGAGNWVYDIVTQGGTRAVVRFMRSNVECRAAVYWSQTLRPLGVPLPALLAHHAGETPWMMLDRLPGVYLGHAYGDLTLSQKLG